MQHVAVYELKLVAAPFSNQEGEWFWKDPEMRAILSTSRLYMIGQRQEVFFRNYRVIAETFVQFDLQCGDIWLRNLQMGLDQFEYTPGRRRAISIGEKIIRILQDGPTAKSEKELIHWFTPDRLFHFYAHDRVKVRHLENFREFTRFQLHYVGISEQRDSFTRLFKNAHEKRSRILGNEKQIRDTARLTDELTLFLFDAESIEVQSFSKAEDFDDARAFAEPAKRDEIINDAERAFIKILQSRYNDMKYTKFPTPGQGLARREMDRIMFAISEPISFVTETTAIQGGLLFEQTPAYLADAIKIENGNVTLEITRDIVARSKEKKDESPFSGPVSGTNV